jgi:hypothetical protein
MHELGHSLGLKHYLPTFDPPCSASSNPKQYNLSSVMNSKCGVNDNDGTPFSPNTSPVITHCDIAQLVSANLCVPSTPTPTPIPYYPLPEGCYNPIDNFSGNSCPTGFAADPGGGYCCSNSTPTPTPGTGGGGGGCLSGFTTDGKKSRNGVSPKSCSPCNPDSYELDACFNSGGNYDWSSCFCGASPIVIDISGNGFNLTDNPNGVLFDINGDGRREQLSWTSADSDDAWLSLDVNGSGGIDNGRELFGNFTDQPRPPQGQGRNGFLALAEHDKFENGGNGDGKITQQDVVFNNLRLWRDANHNGVSESNELKTLDESGLAEIELDYKESKRSDEHGNQFKYRAKVKDTRGNQIRRWAWDVFLVRQN